MPYRITVDNWVGVNWIWQKIVMDQWVPDYADDVDQLQRHEELHVKSNTILFPQVSAATITRLENSVYMGLSLLFKT